MAVACAQSKGYSGRSDTVWTLLNGLRTPAVHDWLNRFSAFCQKNAAERQLENAEMLCLIRLGKGLELMNLLDKPEEVSAQPRPTQARCSLPSSLPTAAPQRLGLECLPDNCAVNENDCCLCVRRPILGSR